MKIAIFIKILLFFTMILESVFARPVSYKDSWTTMSYNDRSRNSLLVHYSPSSKYSIGYKVEYWQEKEYLLNTINLNYLAKRINKKKSQTNIYLNSGWGLINTENKKYNNKKELVSYGGISSDWETRRLFTSYDLSVLKSPSIDGNFMQKVRLGFAPYLVGYGKLHTWFMYELNHFPEDNKNFTSNFILRLFKSTNLLELGLDENENTTLNFIKRF